MQKILVSCTSHGTVKILVLMKCYIPSADIRDSRLAPGHARSEYSIALPDANPRHYLLLDAAGSGLADTSKSYPFNDAGNAYVPVTDTLFDKDALVFEDGQLPSVGLVDADKKPFVTLTCTDFPYVGIWSKPDGPYVCLEPWIGRTDNMDFTGDLNAKPGEQKLIANAEAVHTYTNRRFTVPI